MIRAADEVEVALADGFSTFMGLKLEVALGVLVPRADTELLAKAAIQHCLEVDSENPCVVDMCTGAGNLACAIAQHVPKARVFASDLTHSTVELARRNAERHELSERLTVAQGDLFAALEVLGLENSVDVVVCNPPYISKARLENEKAHLLEREPREAFDAGPYGLSIHQRVAREALRFLKPGGWLLFEIGLGQERQVKQLMERTRGYGDFGFRNDGEGRPRVVMAARCE